MKKYFRQKLLKNRKTFYI